MFYAFDLLYLDGRNLMDEPLLDRKRALRKLVAKRRSSGGIRYTDHVLRDGEAFFKKLKSLAWRGWWQSGLIVVIGVVGHKCG